MGPNFWRHPANGLKKCSEKTRTSCTDHDDCCAVTACTYCLELEVYGDPVQHGVADQAANHWTGTVGGYPFDMYWERNYETGVCELIVIFDGEEVYRKSCEDGQSCRDSSDEVEVIVGYPPESATLRWIKHEPLQLPHIDDPDTGCKTWFCGECDCSCDCLCVTITDPENFIFSGEICNVNSYDCEGPLWQGQVIDYYLSILLGRDEYGDCIITATVDGYEQPPVVVSGCKNMSATIVLEDGTSIAVVCKTCACAVSLCCGGRDLAGDLFLKMVYPGTGGGCGDTSITLTGGGGNWYGSADALAEIPGGGGEECVPFSVHFWFYCDPGGPVYQLAWYYEYLGVRTPLADWCGLAKLTEDCDEPYLGTWAENEDCAPAFWNGFFTFLVSEAAI